jgi:nitrite reductase/ring-hydroxylating ferredoxin subunit
MEPDRDCGCERGCEREQRRTFLQLAGGGAAALVVTLLSPMEALAKKVGLKLDRVAKLKQVGGWTVVKIKGREILLIRDSATSVRALTSKCSHRNTHLTYDPKVKQVHCPKHGSRFTLGGKVLKGPADKPLSPVYPAKLDSAKQRVIIDL